MSVCEREDFLAAPHVGILSVIGIAPDPAAGLLAVPVWYTYRPGGLVTIITGRNSMKGRLLRAAGRFALCVQQERDPTRYVSVEGPVTAIDDPTDPAEQLAMFHRYLTPALADAYLATAAEHLVDNITVRMRPQRWNSADFAALATDLEARVLPAEGGVGPRSRPVDAPPG
ncbi:pyridoxamine 5'-phosphate oxidase family protein [Streptomyces sp. NRRL S-350]|uniref:pyridoxamine 5'-phosphate oxidase family protein n=1 Tax=Streptomyces sp. NRRL S-350 TaxID=1463902 RepID=UPI00068F806A|nr:pyridoxamine 5'-phosphate oxidase family protein [Streptomyces sp. NRRL S-350]